MWAASNHDSPQRWVELREEFLERYPEEFWVDNYLASVFIRV